MKTIGLLIKESSCNSYQIKKHYLDPLHGMGVNPGRVSVHPLMYEGKRVRVKIAKAYLEKLRKDLDKNPIEQLIIADGQYFKILTGVSRVAKAYGESTPCVFPGYQNYTAVYVPNWQQLFYDPSAKEIIEQGLLAVQDPTKKEIITYARYAANEQQAEKLLDGLMSCHALTCDIETTGLALGSELVSISFAWNENQGIAIYCYKKHSILQVLRKFFDRFPGKLIFHRALFDVKHLIWILYMSSPGDLPGMFLGLRVFRHVEDSQLLTYLALNSTTDVSLGLKENSYEYTGNYAVDVTNCLNVPPDELLVYNLKDSLATWYVWNKYWSVCEKDDQLRVYAEIFQPSIRPLLQMMLIGLPIDLDRVSQVEKELRTKQTIHEEVIAKDKEVQRYNYLLQYREMKAVNDSLKKKFKRFSTFRHIRFNPNSSQQVAELLHDRLGYPVLQKTDTGLPATGTKVLEMLIGRGSHDALIENLLERRKTDKILTSFIPAFYAYTIDGFLHGELNLGGTQSGRLSSTNPNMTNLPSGSTYGKKVKSCFIAPKGWLIWYIDFNALEDRIHAILSEDPNKEKVYVQGYDGHCLRAYSYFGNQMGDINPDDPTSINSIEHIYKNLRNRSKAPSFALQYGGTYFTLMKNCGFSKEEATQIESAYKDLYQVSEEFTKQNVEFASKHGYLEIAFGLRIRTPILAKCVPGSLSTPYAAKAEGRSADNAVTQSWGMLINRAVIAASTRVVQEGLHMDVLFSNVIHDSAMGIIKDDPTTIAAFEKIIVEEMEWNDHPKIKSTNIPMKASLELGKSWDSLQ